MAKTPGLLSISLFIAVLILPAPSTAIEPSQELRHQLYGDPVPGPVVTEAYTADEHRRATTKIQINKVLPEQIGAVPPACDIPVLLAMEYWATRGNVDWKVNKPDITSEQYDVTDFLIHMPAVQDTVENTPFRTLNWTVNRLRLLKDCKWYFNNADARQKATELRNQAEALEQQINR